MALQNHRLRNGETWRAFRNRQRFNANHSTELFNSQFSSLNTYLNGYQFKRRDFQVDDVLWFCSFVLTVWYFELPLSLFTDRRVDWFFLSCSILCQISFFLIGLYLCSKHDKNSAADWHKIYPKLFSLAIILFVFSCMTFCFATWSLWNFWTIYIVLVTFMFTIVVISFL